MTIKPKTELTSSMKYFKALLCLISGPKPLEKYGSRTVIAIILTSTGTISTKDVLSDFVDQQVDN